MERKIVQVLSHNVVLAKLLSGNNSIVFGKGIGFKKKNGDLIDPAAISQEFLLHTAEAIEHYQQVIKMVNFPIIAATEEVIALAIQKLSGPFSDTIHAALIDHINFAIERIKRGIYLSNPFVFEIKYLYPEEYKIAEEAVAYLNKKLDVTLPEEEIAFLATHFHSARSFSDKKVALGIARIVSKILDQLKAEGYKMDASFSMIRFVSHLKALIDRVKSGKTIDNPLIESIRERYSDGFAKARKLADIIAEELGKDVPDKEIGFLTLHLERLPYEFQ
ncbi:PRD domain-containing protein [Aneurinibacillus thermoaerophilus]|uniref:PRD domain-containing protein n=1 Tax=Aneurinibacillus thermoaerophilus TaxID=143495 RepID=UPI002E23099A|nr:PRD domain-containing protein [Aneurinibacillus thermoaerophilus]MED0737438.1 PRD domain-containing protein [Aneurinibacillus thermoaerophilus]